MPACKFNIVIFGENTEDSAGWLLGLKPKRSTTLIATALPVDEEANEASENKLFSIWEQHENPSDPDGSALDLTPIYEEKRFLDLDHRKDSKLRALQSCCKIVEAPSETAYFVLRASSNHRKFLTNVANEADLIVVDINEELVFGTSDSSR